MALVKYPAIPADVARNDVDNNWSATQSFGSGAQIHEAGTGQFGQVTVSQPAANTAHMVLTPAASAGAPASGAHLAGELHLDGATPPVLRICTVAGTPGTWAAVSGGTYTLPDGTTSTVGGVEIRTAASGAHPIALTTDDLAAASGVATLDGSSKLVQNLDGAKVTTGTVADARLSGNVSLLASAQSSTAQKTFTGDSTHEPVVYSPQSGNAHALWTPGAAALPLVSHQPGFVTAGVVYSLGDEYVDSLGTKWMCTTAGTGTASVWTPFPGNMKPNGTPIAGVGPGQPLHPNKDGLYDWTDDIWQCTNSTVTTAQHNLSKLWAPSTLSLKSLTVANTINGTTGDNTANQCVLAVMSSTGVVLWQSADVGATVFNSGAGNVFLTTLISAGSPSGLTINGGQDVFVWLSIVMTWSGGTTPQFAVRTATGANGNIMNGPNNTASTAKSATATATWSGSTLQAITPGSNSPTTKRFWFGVNVN